MGENEKAREELGIAKEMIGKMGVSQEGWGSEGVGGTAIRLYRKSMVTRRQKYKHDEPEIDSVP
jgi:hypothetical protein